MHKKSEPGTTNGGSNKNKGRRNSGVPDLESLDEDEDNDGDGCWWEGAGIIREVRAMEKEPTEEAEGTENNKTNPLLYKESSNRLNGATQIVSYLCDTGCNVDCVSMETAEKLKLKIKEDSKFQIKDAQDNDLKVAGESFIYVTREDTEVKARLKVVVIKELGNHEVILSLQTLKH